MDLAYLAAAVLFVLGLRGLQRPGTGARGNLTSAAGMLLAAAVTLLHAGLDYRMIAAALVAGSLVGVLMALKVPTTAMPQLVALLNGLGGAASALVGAAELLRGRLATVSLGETAGSLSQQAAIGIAASGLIGAGTFSGSMAAFAKLQGLVTEKAVVLPGRNAINVVLGLAAITLGARVAVAPGEVDPFWMLLAVSLVLGVLMALPVGGADMPVVIALLNSYSGLAAAATGFALSNSVLVIAGALVGASGLILTQLMCRAMNRSMLNVLSGGWSTTEVSAESSQDFYAGRVKSTSPEEVAILLDGVRRLTVVPGYGLAVAQAQYAVRDLAQALSDRGVTVDFAIHPVAGRMPGHMNVLLTEANISYERLKELEPANSTLTETDLALVIGANDVVNPAARDPSSPIAGMPVLEVDKARTVVVVKRSLAAGFAGIPNPLFVAPNTLMLFADAKEGVLGILKALKEP